MADYVFATTSTWVTQTVQIHRGEVWEAHDPLVVAHPQWFTRDPSAFVRRTGPQGVTAADVGGLPTRPAPVEQATRAPGEKRVSPRA